MRGGDLVYLARLAAGLTQVEVGLAAGIAQNAVSRIERCEGDAGFETITGLVRACGFDLRPTLVTRDGSVVRDVRRQLALRPLQRLEQAVELAHRAQAIRRAGVRREVAGSGAR